jgi:hypothetical protein
MSDRRDPDPRTFSAFAKIRLPKLAISPMDSLRWRAVARAILIARGNEWRRQEEAEFGKLTPMQEALVEGADNPGVRLWLLRFHRVAEVRAIAYERPLECNTPEEFRAFREVNRLSDGRASYLQKYDVAEWNRLKAVAEKIPRAPNKSK